MQTDRPYFFVVLPVDQKINLVSAYRAFTETDEVRISNVNTPKIFSYQKHCSTSSIQKLKWDRFFFFFSEFSSSTCKCKFLDRMFSVNFKGALSCPRQFLATETPLKKMKNAFYYTSEALFVLKILNFLCWLFGQNLKKLH